MRTVCKAFFEREGIEAYGFLPIEEVRITYEALLTREGPFTPRSVLLYLIPYYTGPAENLSLYAVSRDYHRYMKEMSERLLAALGAAYPGETFRAFCDHSPIDERHAAAAAGLGILGDNGLLIHEKYGSLIFVGEILSTLPPPRGATAYEVRTCEHCGACRRACPTGALLGKGDCLSELTQRKGELSAEALRLMCAHRTVWGCDICQTVCPHTRRAIAAGCLTPISFFHEERIPHMTSERLAAMSREELSGRAFGWRGRATIARNLAAYERACEED